MRFLVLALALSAAGPAMATTPATSLFRAGDLFDLQLVTDPQISPDGRLVAYVRQTFDIMTDRAHNAIWLIDTATAGQQPLDGGSLTTMSPRWSPDGKRLAYIAREKGRSALFVRWLQGGRATRVAELDDSAGELRWSPDGRSIAFVMRVSEPARSLGSSPAKPAGANWAPPLMLATDLTYRRDTEGWLKPGFMHVFVVASEGGAVRQMTSGAFDDQGPIAWMPDGKALLFSGNRTADWQREPTISQIYRLSLGDGAVTALTRRAGPSHTPRVSPDGKSIAFLGYDDRLVGYQDSQVHVMDSDGRQDHVVGAALNRSVGDLDWTTDGHALLVQYADAGVIKLARMALDGRVRPIASGLGGSQLDRPYAIGAAFSASRDAVAFASGSSEAPNDLSIVRSGRISRLTRLNDAVLAGKTLAKTRPLAVRSSFDGRPIDAWLVTPPNFDPAKKYPLILEIHGGPYGTYGGNQFGTDMQLYAAAGYMVVYANPRGSASYGDSFANLIQGEFPGHDYDDLMSAVDAAIATGSVDPEQLFVTGGSGGGLLTAWIVGKTHRFRAAATQKPVINATSYVLTTDEAASVPLHWYGKMPWEDVDNYWRHSPLALVGNVTTPTLVVVGAEDYRTPAAEAEQYYVALKLRGVPTALIEVPGAGHLDLTARPSQSAAKASAILAWFDRYRLSTDAHPRGQ